jgi:hypothetical protein
MYIKSGMLNLMNGLQIALGSNACLCYSLKIQNEHWPLQGGV